MADDSDQKVVTAQVFRLEDKEGKVYAELKLNDEGFPVLVMFNKAQKKRVIVGIAVEESDEFATVALCDENEEPKAGILVMANGEQEFFGFSEMVERNRVRQREEEKEE